MLSKEQLMMRKNGIGGSDVAAILGVSKYRTAVDVYFDKISEEVSEEQSEVQYWGSVLEPVILNKYLESRGLSSLDLVHTGTYCHEEHEFMFATLDGMMSDRLVEVKTARTSEGWGEAGTDEIPHDYLCQTAHYSAIYKLPTDIPVLIGGSDFRIYRYERVQKFEDYIMEKEYNFWHNHVLKRIPPNPLTESDFKRVWGQSQDSAITASELISMHHSTLNDVRSQIKELEDLEGELINKIKGYMGTNSTLVDEFGKVLATWKTSESNILNQKLLGEKYPDIKEICTTASNQRRFLPKK